jgi:ubiquitin-protein ligase
LALAGTYTGTKFEAAPLLISKYEWHYGVLKEITDLNTDPPTSCSAGPAASDPYQWEAMIIGPETGSYTGGDLQAHCPVPGGLSIQAPHIQFKTKIYHPNINASGMICLDYLESTMDSPVALL